ncbi:MAG TPA: hypothetical protein PKW35_18195 [Nannocystaceae bacterium]|nr:hypothetical protein [Nannocystaceae bacterium]
MASTHAHPKLLLAALLIAACPADEPPASPTSATEASAASDTDADASGTTSTSDSTTAPTTSQPTESDTTALSPSTCGDGDLEPGEECDLGPQNANDGACTLACTLPICGDGFVQPGEECDLGPQNANEGACTLACAEATCGDGFVQPGEACDLGPENANGGACTLACAEAICGDGFIHAGVEECDDGDANDADNYNGCHPVTCTRVSWCGDGVTQPEEECDPEDPDVPELTCTDDCQIIRKVIFVTSATFNGKLGGLAGADQTCQKLAGAAGLANPTTFRAWLSDGFEPISKRIPSFEGPYVRPDGVQIADHWQDLTDGDLDAPISIDEAKQNHFKGESTSVWTNVGADGSIDGYISCDGWTLGTLGKPGSVGRLNTTGSEWTHHSELLCFLQAHLYCVEG